MAEPPAAKKTRVHFGSFEEKEKQISGREGGSGNGVSASILAGIEAGNINIDGMVCIIWKP